MFGTISEKRVEVRMLNLLLGMSLRMPSSITFPSGVERGES